MADEPVLTGHWRLPAFALRTLLFVLVTAIGWATVGPGPTIIWGSILLLAALPAFIQPDHRVLGPAGRLVETGVVILGTLSTGGIPGWLLPYLIVPLAHSAYYAAEFVGEKRLSDRLNSWEPVVLTSGAVIGLVVVGTSMPILDNQTYFTEVAQFIVLALIAAICAWWVKRSQYRDHDSSNQPYVEAAALLTQLRAVARQLPGGTLNPGGIATDIVNSVAEVPGTQRVAVLGASAGRRLVVLAQHADERVDWETSPQLNSLLADAWAGQQPQSGHLPLSRSAGGPVASLVVPLVAEQRTVALVAVESEEMESFASDVVKEVQSRIKGMPLRLETALLFEEVRSLATAEERQRLAREIHDGIAQELAMLGYGIDNATAVVPEEAVDARKELEDLRSEVTRLVTELRFSLFELRSDVDRQGGLTASIADYARTVASSAGLRVHLSLDEGGARLPASVEAELLRIAQESITNARKHARAENLWVTCEVDPPYARVEVTDDGRGMSGDQNDGRYGLAIMSERAERIRGSLEIRPRKPHGTTVAVVLHASQRPSAAIEAKDEETK